MMLTVISPAKKLDYSSSFSVSQYSQPAFLEHSKELLEGLKKLSPQDVCALMGLSDKLGALNYERFQEWSLPFDNDNAKPAVLAFKGDVYQGLSADSMSAEDLNWAQDHLRILSGLYGVLRPLDLMQPYRLEMGTRLDTKAGSDLYQYWGSSISESLMADLEEHEDDLVINLASNEYFKAVSASGIHTNINTPVFKDFKNGKYKIISFFAKNARGAMARWIVKEKVKEAIDLVNFREDGYEYNEELSEVNSPVFLRG